MLLRSLLACVICWAGFCWAGDGPKKSDSVVKVKARADKPATDGTQLITVTIRIEKGYHIYANPIGNDDLKPNQTEVTLGNGAKIDKAAYSKGKLKKDSILGDYYIYEDEAIIKLTVQKFTGTLDASVKFQACSDKSCLLPASVKVPVEKP